MTFTLTDEARRYIAVFEAETGATAHDCLLEAERAVFVVAPGDMADAIGPGGQTVTALEQALDRSVELVEDAETPEAFVANVLAPAAVRNVTISETDTTIAYAEVPDPDKGIAIGSDGRNIDLARRLVARHFDIDDIELT